MAFWEVRTSLDRQAAAAEMWLEMTGRTKTAQAGILEEFAETAEKLAARPPNPKLRTRDGLLGKTWSPKDQDDSTLQALDRRIEWARSTPSNRSWKPHPEDWIFSAPGAAGGAALGHHISGGSLPVAAAGGALSLGAGVVGSVAGRKLGRWASHRRVKKEISRRDAQRAEAGRAAHRGIARGLNAKYVDDLEAHARSVPLSTKQASTKERLLGAAGGALALGGLGAAKAYRQHRPGANGRSRAQMAAQRELDEMRQLYAHEGRDVENLPGFHDMRHRFAEAKLRQYDAAVETPGHAALAQGIPWALGGAAMGGALGPKVSRIAGRLRK